MKKQFALIILVCILITATGCGVTHETEINSESVITSIENISELGGK